MTYHQRRGAKKYIQFDWTILTHQAINMELFYFPINSADSGLLSITHLFSTEWESSLLTVQSDSIHFFLSPLVIFFPNYFFWLLKVSFLPLRLGSLPFKTKHYHDCLTSFILFNRNHLHYFPEAWKIHTSSPCCLCTFVLTFLSCSQSFCLDRVQHICSIMGDNHPPVLELKQKGWAVPVL